MIHCWNFLNFTIKITNDKIVCMFLLSLKFTKFYRCLLSVNILFQKCVGNDVRILIFSAMLFLLQAFRTVRQLEIWAGWWIQGKSILSQATVTAQYSLVYFEIPAVCSSVFSQVTVYACTQCPLVKKSENTNVFESYWEVSL